MFTNNEANWGGGAIYSCGGVTISGNPTFNGNSCYTDHGGAICLESDTMIISGNPTFENNYANQKSPSSLLF